MQIPHLAIYVNAKSEFVMSHVMTRDGDPLNVERPLKELSDRGLEAASKGIGRVVLASMANFYPQEMRNYPELVIPYDEDEDMLVIGALISKSVLGKTEVHFASIDTLIQDVLREKPELATSSHTIAAWPEIRKNLARQLAK